jgi:hypothetical protein
MSDITTTFKKFHGYIYNEEVFQQRSVETLHKKRLVIQEREVSYKFYTHAHPFVGQLVQLLLRKSTAGLQAADTQYQPHNLSLPGSVEVAIEKASALSIPADSPFVLLDEVEAATPEPGRIVLPARMKLRLAAATSITVPDGLRAGLFDGLTNTPSAGSVFALPKAMGSSILNDIKITFAQAAQITLHDGTQATIAAGTQALLLIGAQFTLPKDMPVTMLRSKPKPVLYADIFSDKRFNPSALVQRPFPVNDLDFTYSGAYSIYNWELFFHVPLTIAMHLSKNQRFAEAQRWFHYLFDPTDDSDGPTPERFWKVRPFQTTEVKKIEEILVNLASNADPALRDETVSSIEAWRDAPFRPHVIARYRQQAYMYKTVMAYLDNLLAWGDSLFRQDTGEAIDEALMLYVLAANILGPRPQPVPKKGSVRPQTYANLRADLKQFGVVMREAETAAPFDLMPFPKADGGDNERLTTLRSLGKALYFCVPRNDKLLSYWDTVADRLFKIRNSLNFQGIFRQLALFEPPIDPAMLARAVAAGLEVGAIVNGLNQPLPLVRFQFLAQKAAEICQEVKALGSQLLVAMEKEDNEALSLLRARHERIVMEMVEQVRYTQVQEAIKSREGLLKSLMMAVQRYTYYERQLGKKPEEIEAAIPEIAELDRESLLAMKFAMEEPEMRLRELEVDIAQDLNESGGKLISSHEAQEMAKLQEARDEQGSAADLDKVAGAMAIIPNFGAKFSPFGVGASISFGGSNLASGMSFLSSFNKTSADKKTYESGKTAKIGSYSRRQQDWAFQSNLAAGEITQIFRQIRAAEIRQAIAELELRNHRKHMQHAKEIEHFLNEEGAQKTGKKTNKALYTWMKREVKGLYGQSFQLAFDLARKAERALQHELGNPELSYIQFGYLAGKEGLLAGEKLYLDIKRMEMAYHELNQREYELTRHVSLLQLNPMALLQLRTTGKCIVALPETLFDMDGPGHYFRRIKNVALSIPCVTGPYSGVNCTLTLLKSSIRKTPILRDGAYAREDAEDSRFNDYFGSLQSIVTSSAQNDSGLFETNLRDERYLPFENSGVVSEWRLELPANPDKNEPCQFDYNTISDVILHIRYTARQGGELLRKAAMKNLNEAIKAAQAAGSVRLFSVRHEFPGEWAKFQSQKPVANQPFELALSLRNEHFPFWSQERLKSVTRVDILARSSQKPVPASLEIFYKKDANAPATKNILTRDIALGGLLVGKLSELPAKPASEIKLTFEDRALQDLWIAITWADQ